MIRPIEPRDSHALVALAMQTAVFKPHEIEALDEVLNDYHVTHKRLGHRAVAMDSEGQVAGFAYYAPAAMTDRTWYLWWIAVSKQAQAKGIGSQLLKHAEEEVRQQRGRLLLIETSSLPTYDPARRFYLKHDYQQAAVITDFYADGDDIIVFSKRLVPKESQP